MEHLNKAIHSAPKQNIPMNKCNSLLNGKGMRPLDLYKEVPLSVIWSSKHYQQENLHMVVPKR